MLFAFKSLRYILIISVVLIFSGCHKAVIPDIIHIQYEVPEIALVLPVDATDSLYRGLKEPKAVIEFYRSTGQRAGWVDRDQTRVLGDSLLTFIRQLRLYGLLPQHYHIQELTAENRLHWRPEFQLRRDVLLTDAFIAISKDIRFGRQSANEPDSTVIGLLHDVLVSGQLKKKLTDQQPDFIQYHALREALERLIVNADSSSSAALMGGATIDSLSAHRKVRIIEINLERWRMEKQPWGSRYIFVNIPSYMLALIEQDELVMETRSIVGRPKNATPEFSSMVQCFVTYPFWHVPRKIAVEEFLPAIQRDTSFIARNNFDVLDRRGNVLHPDSVDWKSFNKNKFPVILRQREGQENSLGILKFVFDNPYAVFVHDTNAPRLFRHKKRALSHGCIRIEQAVALAHYLATGQSGKKSEMLESHLRQKVRHTVEIAEPIPIHIRYFTASTDSDGTVVFFEDIYEKDQELIDRLYGSHSAYTTAVAESDYSAR